MKTKNYVQSTVREMLELKAVHAATQLRPGFRQVSVKKAAKKAVKPGNTNDPCRG